MKYVACHLEFFLQDIWMKVDGALCLSLIRIWSHNGYSTHVLLICRLTHKRINISQYW